ncbi:MAG: hypothetical protein WDM78_11050 [Puia sp.]
MERMTSPVLSLLIIKDTHNLLQVLYFLQPLHHAINAILYFHSHLRAREIQPDG